MGEEGWKTNPFGTGIYPKAQVLNRFIAKFIDAILAGAAGKLLPPIGWMAGLAYILVADGFSGGQSLGKRLIGLQIVIPHSRHIPGFKESIIRNLPFAVAYLLFSVPYVGWAFALAIAAFEALLIIGNDRGLRLGDELAHTQVLDAGLVELHD